MEVYEGGSLVQLHGLPGRATNAWGKRGTVRAFTWESRKNLLRTVASIDRRAMQLGLFITLTYPDSWSTDPRTWKRNLDTFFKRVKRAHPTAAMVWKLEPQKRWAPHFHLILFNVGEVTKCFKLWLSRVWFEVVGSGDPKHLAAGTQAQRFKSWSGVMAYAGKYLGKEQKAIDEGWQKVLDVHGFKLPATIATKDDETVRRVVWCKVGRWWGVYGREHLKRTIRRVHLTVAQFDQVRASIREVLRHAWEARQVQHSTTSTTSTTSTSARRRESWKGEAWREGYSGEGVTAFIGSDEFRAILQKCGVPLFY